MKSKICMIGILSVLATNSFGNTCLETYRQKSSMFANGDAISSIGFGSLATGAIYHAVTTSFAFPLILPVLAIPVAAGSVGYLTYQGIKARNNKLMVKLIKESYTYKRSGDIGPVLKRTLKFSKEKDVETLTSLIISESVSGTLCRVNDGYSEYKQYATSVESYDDINCSISVPNSTSKLTLNMLQREYMPKQIHITKGNANFKIKSAVTEEKSNVGYVDEKIVRAESYEILIGETTVLSKEYNIRSGIFNKHAPSEFKMNHFRKSRLGDKDVKDIVQRASILCEGVL